MAKAKKESHLHVRRILHPEDFSTSSARAREYAHALAQLTGAELHVLHVLGYPEGVRTSEAEVRRGLAAARARLGELCEPLGEVKTVVRLGSAHVEIARYVREAGIDLVVIGSVGLSGEGSIGSTAEKILRAVDVPVLTIKAEASRGRRRCALCGAESGDVLCDACKDRVRGDAAGRRRGL
jgi:nucleotide-binding universal stress UspA family protein